jgi:ribosomal protein S18 acetylase RimI-like enzyme
LEDLRQKHEEFSNTQRTASGSFGVSKYRNPFEGVIGFGMNPSQTPYFKIREIDPDSKKEVSLVASRMRQTLIEVLGEEKGTSLYSMDWLLERVKWHLDPVRTTAKIFLAETPSLEIIGHAIVRIEKDDEGNSYGYFSTIFIEPGSRNRGIANTLLLHVEDWLREMKLPKVIYNTAENHSKLIRLFERNGYQITDRALEMVQLTKSLGPLTSDL